MYNCTSNTNNFYNCIFFGLQGTPQLRYSADYEVIKEQNIAEKISFLNENLPQSSCVKVMNS